VEALRKAEPVMRRILGAAAATVATPFLFAAILFFPGYLFDRFQRALSVSEILTILVNVEAAVFRMFWILLLPACLICGGLAFLLERMGFRSRLFFMTGGALMSLALMLWVIWEPTPPPDRDRWTLFVTLIGSAAIAGALGGWIYWRIALSPRAREPAGAP
jgi:hypothetical protein